MSTYPNKLPAHTYNKHQRQKKCDMSYNTTGASLFSFNDTYQKYYNRVCCSVWNLEVSHLKEVNLTIRVLQLHVNLKFGLSAGFHFNLFHILHILDNLNGKRNCVRPCGFHMHLQAFNKTELIVDR